jgi:hypothetical protein
MFLKKIIFWLMLTLFFLALKKTALFAVKIWRQLHVSLFETLCDLQGFAERAKQKTVIAV